MPNSFSDLILLAGEQGQHAAQNAYRHLDRQRTIVSRLKSKLGARQISLHQALKYRYRGAIPIHDRLQPANSEKATPLPCFGVDGSQIYPREDSPAHILWAQAVGYQVGRGVVKEVGEWIEPNEAGGNESIELFRHLVDTTRATLEMEVAAVSSSEGLVALVDGGLLLWTNRFTLSGQIDDLSSRHDRAYLEISPRPIAGIICNPRSQALVNLALLLEVGFDRFEPCQTAIFDRDIIRGCLEVGLRTNVFLMGSSANSALVDADAAVYFYYTRVGDSVLRVEVPHWIAVDDNAVNQIQASIVKDSTALGGYPYVLAQAHNHVVISTEVADAVFYRAEAEYLRAGGKPIYPSRKQLAKGQ